MKGVVVFTLLMWLTVPALCQTQFLKDAVVKLEGALITKDTNALKQLLHKDVTFGHSNGWVQRKNEVVKDLSSGKITYREIKSKDLEWTVTDNVTALRSHAEISYVLDGKAGDMKLHILQVWMKSAGRWQLVARQSTRLN